MEFWRSADQTATFLRLNSQHGRGFAAPGAEAFRILGGWDGTCCPKMIVLHVIHMFTEDPNCPRYSHVYTFFFFGKAYWHMPGMCIFRGCVCWQFPRNRDEPKRGKWFLRLANAFSFRAALTLRRNRGRWLGSEGWTPKLQDQFTTYKRVPNLKIPALPNLLHFHRWTRSYCPGPGGLVFDEVCIPAMTITPTILGMGDCHRSPLSILQPPSHVWWHRSISKYWFYPILFPLSLLYISLYPHNCWSLWFYRNLLPTNIYTNSDKLQGFCIILPYFSPCFMVIPPSYASPGDAEVARPAPFAPWASAATWTAPAIGPSGPRCVRRWKKRCCSMRCGLVNRGMEMDIWLVVWNMAFTFHFIYGYGYIYIYDKYIYIYVG